MSFELLNRSLFISRALKNSSIFLTTLQNKTAIAENIVYYVIVNLEFFFFFSKCIKLRKILIQSVHKLHFVSLVFKLFGALKYIFFDGSKPNSVWFSFCFLGSLISALFEIISGF